MLRVINKSSEVSPSSLNFIALAASPLVDEGGNPREGYRLDLDNEMRAIHETLQNSGKNLAARRIPPTREQLRQQAGEEPASPDPDGEDGFEAQLQAQLAELPPERRTEVEAQIRKAYAEFQRISPEEKAEKLQAAQAAEEAQRRKRVDQYADQARDAGLAYFRKQAPKRDVLNMLEESAAQMKANEKSDSPWLEVAELCLAIAALIKDEPVPPVPAAYASHFSAVQSEMKK
jgi:hypothetical protein